MSRTFTTIGQEGREDPLKRIVRGVNAQLEDRGCIGDLDATDQSFDVCLSDAVADLGGVWDVRDRDHYYIALDGAPLAAILPDDN